MLLKWLHFSDIHVSAESEWDADRVRRAFVADIKQTLTQKPSLKPDYVFFTGDAAFSGQAGELQIVSRFFADVLAACGVTPENFFVVPGNHDCDRSRYTPATMKQIKALARRRSHEALAKFFTSPGRTAAFDPLEEFAKIVPAHCRPGPTRFFWTHRPVSPAGVPPVVLIGLNTAWATFDDKAKPILGRYQIDAALRAAEIHGDEIVFALMHHPTSSLLEWDNEESWGALFSGDIHITLHGHLHANMIWERLNSALSFGAGSAYASSRYKNSYNLGQLNFKSRRGKLFVRRWFPERHVWLPDPEVGERGGHFQFAIPANRIPRPQPPFPHAIDVEPLGPPQRIIGIDVGSSKIAVRLLEVAAGRNPILCEEMIQEPIARPADAHLVGQLQSIIVGVTKRGFEPDGVGIAVPGQVDLRAGVLIFAPNLNMRSIALKSEIERFLHQRGSQAEVRIDNDARCATRCELHLGVGRQFESFVCIFFGNGVGSGIVIDRKVYVGHHFCAGEIGHHKLDLNGSRCNCGRCGCFETYVNASAIVRSAEALTRRVGKKTMLARVAGKITTYNIADAAANDDKVAKQVLDEIGELIGAGIANYINILDPGAVILGGGVIHGLFQFMARSIRKGIDENVIPELRPTIVTSAYVDEAPAIGAALLFNPADRWLYGAREPDTKPKARRAQA